MTKPRNVSKKIKMPVNGNLTLFWCSNELMHCTHVYYAGKRVPDTSLPAGSSCSVQAPGLWIRWRDSPQRSQTLDAVQRFLLSQDVCKYGGSVVNLMLKCDGPILPVLLAEHSKHDHNS